MSMRKRDSLPRAGRAGGRRTASRGRRGEARRPARRRWCRDGRQRPEPGRSRDRGGTRPGRGGRRPLEQDRVVRRFLHLEQEEPGAGGARRADRRPGPTLAVGGHDVGEQTTVGQSARTHGGIVGAMDGRREPLLGPPGRRQLDPAKRGQPASAEVEVVDHVRWQQQGTHARPPSSSGDPAIRRSGDLTSGSCRSCRTVQERRAGGGRCRHAEEPAPMSNAPAGTPVPSTDSPHHGDGDHRSGRVPDRPRSPGSGVAGAVGLPGNTAQVPLGASFVDDGAGPLMITAVKESEGDPTGADLIVRAVETRGEQATPGSPCRWSIASSRPTSARTRSVPSWFRLTRPGRWVPVDLLEHDLEG